MLLTIDTLAQRYKVLPSQCLEQASTFDLYVMNTATEWSSRQQAYAQSGSSLPTPHLSRDEMMSMLSRTRSEL